VRRELESIEIPGEHEARERAWRVLEASFAARVPVARRRHPWSVAAFAVAVAAVAAATLSSPGRAVLDGVREAVGIERAEPALFSLPSPGDLLVTSDAGLWVVHEDGSKRLLGDYREASWSPRGRFVVASRANELAALEPDGGVRWTLARPGVRYPRWTGSETDTRIAYADRSGLRVIAGDGTGDRLLRPGVRGPIAWRSGATFVLTYATSHDVHVIDGETGRTLWAAPRPAGRVTAVEWSSDGTRLLVLSPHHIRVYDAHGRVVGREDPSEGWPDVDAAFRPGSSEVAVARVHGSQSSVYLLDGRSFATVTGAVRQLEWAPNGRWLLVTWQTADQWIVAPADGRRLRAVANVSEQFRSRSFPRIEGWCCAPDKKAP
jgi:hypothetical protein